MVVELDVVVVYKFMPAALAFFEEFMLPPERFHTLYWMPCESLLPLISRVTLPHVMVAVLLEFVTLIESVMEGRI